MTHLQQNRRASLSPRAIASRSPIRVASHGGARTHLTPRTCAPPLYASPLYASPLRALAVCAVTSFILLAGPLVSTVAAQDTRGPGEVLAKALPRFDAMRLQDLLAGMRADPQRAVIGITMPAGDAADTLGVLVQDVTAGGPADKAGIKEGTRIVAINGINLRLSSTDAADPALDGLGQRRLQRAMDKVKAGDEVELRIASGAANAAVQTVKVKTVTAAELEPAPRVGSPMARSFGAAGPGLATRASVGISLGSSGSRRDTLGLFISSVIPEGPAEEAGIFEGARIATVNGVDVRVPREDAEDPQAAMARVSRFQREIAKLAPGDKVTLRVFDAGRYRDVTVTLGSSAELRSNGFQFNFGDGQMGPVIRLPGGEMRSDPFIIRHNDGQPGGRVIRGVLKSPPRKSSANQR